MYTEIKGKKYKDRDPEILAWERTQDEGLETALMNIFPKPGDKIKDKKFFAVKGYEKALFYNKGKLYGVIEGGVYELEKEARYKGTEIVWIDTSLIEVPWGVPKKDGVPTKDGYIIGLHGDLKLRISDVKIFYNDVVAGRREWKVLNLRDWILSLLITSLRDIFKKYNVKDIILEERERVINLVTAKVTEEFVRYGLELETFNIIGLKTPEELDSVLSHTKKKTEALQKAKREDLNDLIQEKDDLQDRIKELQDKKKALQDQLINDKINQETYDKKTKQIQIFIDETEVELKKVEEIISKQ